MQEIMDVDAVFVRNEKITAEIMDAAPKLKVIAKHGVGYDNIDVEAATKRKIQVVYAPRGNTNAVAEDAMMMILCCARRYGQAHNELVRGNYDIRYVLNDAYEVTGKTLGLIGCGNIARNLAKKAKYGFGMKVIGFDPFVNVKTEADIELATDREEVFRQADFISIHMPSTPETRHSIGENEFQMMKKTAYIINTSRGDIIDETALIQALQKGELLGAGLDVFETEPVGMDNPLLVMDEVITSPHIAGMTKEASDKLSLMGAEGIVQALYGEKLTWPVNHLEG